MSDYKLPENFLWGAAIAANQAYPLSSLQGKAGVIQQCNMPKCELGVQ